MQLDFLERKTEGRFVMYRHSDHLKSNGIQDGISSNNTFVWNKTEAQNIWIDNVRYTFPANTILPLMGNQHFRFENPERLVAWQFNREFYCIMNHDQEVGCVGFLFYGIRSPFFITLDQKEIETFTELEKVIVDEFSQADGFQGEMLRSMLKRFIIKATRLGKSQTAAYQTLGDQKLDLIRHFSLLVEINFRSQHEVKFYAEQLNKSPKTLSNFFALYKQPSPSKIIQDRIVLEAKRLFLYTDKSAKEVAFELGFENPEHFSRFFKSKTGSNPSTFKHFGLNIGKN